MWDFSLSQAIGAMQKTMPFILFRMAIYFGITVAYILATGMGAAVGYGLTAFGKDPGSGAGLGGLLGFGAVSGALYWAREYLLYMVKAGHIAVLVEILEGRPLPDNQGQIAYAQGIIQQRFKETSLLFGLDQLIKGILHAANRLILGLTGWLPIPGLNNLVSIVNKVLDMSLTYVDEVIIAYNLRMRSENSWQSSKDALILYAQNYQLLLKNAVFLMLFMYGLSFLVFLVFLAPVGALMGLFPGQVGGWSFIIALVLAWSVKAALLEPIAIHALMQVYFKVIEGQTPDPEWDAKLESVSSHFRELKQKAAAFVNGMGAPKSAA